MVRWYNKGMALILQQQDEKRSKLQQEIAAELQERAKHKARQDELPDGVTDSHYLKGTQRSGKFLWVWIALGAAIVIAIIIFMIQSLAQ